MNFIIIPLFFMLIICVTFFRLEKSNGQTNSSNSGQCIFCTQVVPNCLSNEILIPQSCNECAHCVPTLYTSSGCPQIQTDCFGEPSGCKSKFGIYDPTICKCVCPGSSSGSVNLSCTTDNDCPPGLCSSSGSFKNYSCGNGICNQIFYFADPCQFSQSSSGNSIALNKNFAGFWRGKILNCNGGGVSIDSDCIVCPQIAILCIKDFTYVPQTCHKCGHCEKCKSSKIITLKLCIKDQVLEGTVNIPKNIENGIITSQNIISNNEISITIQTNDNLTRDLNLKLTDNKHLLISIDEEQAFEVKKLSSLRNCPKNNCKNHCGLFCCKENETCEMAECLNNHLCNTVFLGCKPISTSNSSSSSSGSDCSPKGNCRGENGTYLPCPKGTECSGLPAYGCYPPGCPVPICCSPETRIKTTGEEKRIADIKEGEIVLTDGGKAVRVKKVSKTPVKNHKILKITLNDGAVLEISPDHPTADGKKFKDLKMGEILDSRLVVETKLIPYTYSHTYDILPDSKTGNYYANGVLIGSSLKHTK